MAKTARNFTAGKMNKMVDERLIPNGEYIDALNIRMGSTETSEIGVTENSKGNTKLTTLSFRGTSFSNTARTIGAYEDGSLETVYWFVHDSNFTESPTGKLDAIVSYNTNTQIVTYHVVSIDDGGGVNTTLNFDPQYLITGVDKVENLLFFTDNTNPPRKINVIKNYQEPDIVTNIDGFPYDDIMVIKRPPSESPALALTQISNQENYLEERFICFAYRYKYDDDEYSATSQWSDPAFSPKPFDFSTASYLNEGAQNLYNTAEITFNTGGPLVTGIDLLFKDSGNSVIKIIEKLTKEEQGYSDNQEVTYQFSNSKIFTILSEAEILRLYDNVPRLSQASTIMGNRLMYGNYVEGYDLIDFNNNPTRFDYTTSPVSKSFASEEISGTLEQGYFSIGGTSYNYPEGKVNFDLTGVELVEGATITFNFTFSHESWSGPAPTPTIDNANQEFQYSLILTQDFNSVYEFITSVNFTEAVGTMLPGGNIQPMATAQDGTTMTDIYNNLFANVLGSNLKYESGIIIKEQAIDVQGTPGSNEFTMKFLAVQYAFPDVVSPTSVYTEYFQIKSPVLSYSKLGSGQSLHSNRGYEIGIIYMDEFKRSTPALVSQYNTEHFACADANTANSILVDIPTTQVAPYWADSYKFAIKPDKETYETIYSNTSFDDPVENITYFLLLGENSQKITTGQRLIVKKDAAGPISSCVYATVLDKKAQQKNFIEIPIGDTTDLVTVPSGVYMSMTSNSFTTSSILNPIIDNGCIFDDTQASGNGPIVTYPVNLPGTDGNNPTWEFIDYDIPAGTVIDLDFTYSRLGGIYCTKRIYTLKKTLIATQDYDNFEDWWNGDYAGGAMTQGDSDISTDPLVINDPIIPWQFNSQGNMSSTTDILQNFKTISWGFHRNATTNQLQFVTSGGVACGSNENRRAEVNVCITVNRDSGNSLVFESEPLDASPDIWYEGSSNYGIVNKANICQFIFTVPVGEVNNIAFNYTDYDGFSQQSIVSPEGTITVVGQCGTASISPQTPSAGATITSTAMTTGTHLGSVQNQITSTSQPAIIDTGFFNCYAFGNGVESYKIRDSLLGLDLKLGNRVTSTEAQDYAEVRRFADITYSGVFNDESNINKLNEFNGGLLNFKALEESFGPIQKLVGRETNILTLQEDKISYVLVGKDLLSDAGAGNLLMTVPEVLGTQVARVEEYGISHNPESFAQYGPHKYFTDAKRGVVLQLSGSSGTNDTLIPISQFGMATWFRDLYQVSFETQKLGGFDPYMQEYVLTSNTKKIPMPTVCAPCGTRQEILATKDNEYNDCFNLGSEVGNSTITFSVINTDGPYTVTVNYNGVIQNYTGSLSSSITVDKNIIGVSEVSVNITSTGTTSLDLSVGCPVSDTLTLVNVCATSINEGGLTTHNQFRFVDGIYTSPLTSNGIQFGSTGVNPIVSFYDTVTGLQGGTIIPTDGSVVTLTFNKFAGDTANFDVITNKFRFLRTSTNYPNTSQSVDALITASTPMTTVTTQGPGIYTGSFTMPAGNDNDFIYIIYDYRKPTGVDLCYALNITNACCGCLTPPEEG